MATELPANAEAWSFLHWAVVHPTMRRTPTQLAGFPDDDYLLKPVLVGLFMNRDDADRLAATLLNGSVLELSDHDEITLHTRHDGERGHGTETRLFLARQEVTP